MVEFNNDVRGKIDVYLKREWKSLVSESSTLLRYLRKNVQIFILKKKKRNTRAKKNLNSVMYFVITYKSSIDIQRSNDDKHSNYTIIQRLFYHPVNPLNTHWNNMQMRKENDTQSVSLSSISLRRSHVYFNFRSHVWSEYLNVFFANLTRFWIPTKKKRQRNIGTNRNE